jgi:kynurenine formamidase
MGGHVGTHIDALSHVSDSGYLHGGIDARSVQSHLGLSQLGVERVHPILCRGVLLDIAALHNKDVLDSDYEISDRDLEEAEKRSDVRVREGDAVLLRTGWASHWREPSRFLGQIDGAPGPGVAAGEWLAKRRVRLVGAETVAFEAIPPGRGHAELPVHRLLLADKGIHIIEAMDLSNLGSHGIAEFAFIAIPLKLVGATGSPVRPLALING